MHIFIYYAILYIDPVWVMIFPSPVTCLTQWRTMRPSMGTIQRILLAANRASLHTCTYISDPGLAST
jgi:hypothetical protein